MCTNFAKKVESKTPIVAYKVLSVGLDGSIVTPFARCDITEKMLNGEEEFVASEGMAPESSVVGRITNVTLREGYIHTYADKKSIVYDYFNYYERQAGVGYWEVAYRVFEVEIPVDSKEDECWEGIFDADTFGKIGEEMIKEGKLIVEINGALYGKSNNQK